MKPLLFLDVDGVLNPWMATTAPPKAFRGFWKKHEFPSVENNPFKKPRYWVNPAQGRALVALMDYVEIVWATTWVLDPPSLKQLAEMLGLPTDLGKIDAKQDEQLNNGLSLAKEKRDYIYHYLTNYGYKLVAGADGLQAHWQPPVGFIWVDDQIETKDREIIERWDIPSLLIKPNPSRGMDENHMAQVKAFAESLQ